MTQHLEAVYEDGLPRPLQPLAPEEKQHVQITVREMTEDRPAPSRMPEQEWLLKHSEEYAGQWVALEGTRF